jgi:hypothetical protein
MQKYLGNEAQAGKFDAQNLATFDNNRYQGAVEDARINYLGKANPLKQSVLDQHGATIGYNSKLQSAIDTANKAYTEKKQMYDMMGISDQMPQLTTSQDMLKWYADTVQTPQEQIWAQGGIGDGSAVGSRPLDYVNYNELVNQAKGAVSNYDARKTALTDLNSKYGNVFDSLANPNIDANNDVYSILNLLGQAPPQYLPPDAQVPGGSGINVDGSVPIDEETERL